MHHCMVTTIIPYPTALWINGILHNCEVWQELNEKDKKELNKIDHCVLKLITGSHAKAPTEQLYLETASISVTQIISEGELIRNIYEAMKADPLPGDWYKLVQEDFKIVNLDLNEDQILNMNPTRYKSIIKEKMRDAAFNILKGVSLQS